MKRLMAPTTIKIARKVKTFIVRPSAGPHAMAASAPLSVVLRELLGFARNMREAKKVLNERKVLVDGRVVRDPGFPVGFMDVVSVPSVNKHYRVVYDRHGRVSIVEVEPGKAGFKLAKIVNKTVMRGGRLQLNLHDGRNVLTDKKTFRVGDVLKLSLPDQKILDSFPLASGNIAYVTAGKHAGETAFIKEIVPGTQARKALAVMSKGDGTFETSKEYVFVLGAKEPAVVVG
jgi:small subunit ribosomal protein S4e